MTKSIDEWAAEQCGVKLWNDGAIISGPLSGKWTIKDPRCREIVREHLRIATEPYDDDDYRSSTYIEGPESSDDFIHSDAKTIAEAEIACITAIYEAEK